MIRFKGLDGATENFGHLRAARNSIPAGVDTFKDVRFRRIPADRHQEVFIGAAPGTGTHSLAPMHASALRRDLAIGVAEHRIEVARLQLNTAWSFFGLRLHLLREAEKI